MDNKKHRKSVICRFLLVVIFLSIGIFNYNIWKNNDDIWSHQPKVDFKLRVEVLKKFQLLGLVLEQLD
jgi:hypothetical protein